MSLRKRPGGLSGQWTSSSRVAATRLLSDAFYYATSADSANPRMGIILAAIAVEVRIKAFLTERASEEQRDLVELVIDNPRDVTLAAVSLYDKGLKAVVGRSLREEDRPAYNALTALFVERNRLVHKGDLTADISRHVAARHLVAARTGFAYLQELEGS